MLRGWIAVAAVNALLAVAAGAFGAHGLQERLEPKMLANYETGAKYHMYHALAMLIAAAAAAHVRSSLAGAACIAFMAGIVLFSGSLYVLALTGITKLGMVTPFGGLAFMVGWGMLAWAALARGD